MATKTEPGRRQPAPSPLDLVQAFVNTVDLEAGEETWDDPAAYGAWLARQGLVECDERVRRKDLRRALEVREALRALLLANHDGGAVVAPDAIETLNPAAARAEVGVRLDGAGKARIVPDAAEVNGAVGRVLAVVFEAMADGTWPRLKACRNDVCRWAFYDYSKNRSGSWCSMAVCGNRIKTRSYRRRHADDGEANAARPEAPPSRGRS